MQLITSTWQFGGHQVASLSDETQQLLVLVHGWNVTQFRYENGSETMLKRLYWQGYRGRFASLRWPTYSRDDFFILPAFNAVQTFNQSEYRAFRSGNGAADYFQDLRR